MMDKKTFQKTTILFSTYDFNCVEKLTNDELGQIFRAFNVYQRDKKIMQNFSNEKTEIAFLFYKNHLEREVENDNKK
jgi:hypothetical protein